MLSIIMSIIKVFYVVRIINLYIQVNMIVEDD